MLMAEMTPGSDVSELGLIYSWIPWETHLRR